MRSLPRFYCRCFLAGWLALFVASSFAAPSRTLRFEQLGTEQGLPREVVTAIVQDKKGFMWFGGQNGLSRYDGVRVKVYSHMPEDALSLASNRVQALYVDPQGLLWVGSYEGLQRFDPLTETFTHFQLDNPNNNNNAHRYVQAIISDGAKGMWLATDAGLQHLDPASGRLIDLRHNPADHTSLINDNVSALLRDKEGNLWVGTESGLDFLPSGTTRFQHYTVNEGASPEPLYRSISALAFDNKQHLWIGTMAGLEVWTLGADSPQRHRFGAKENIVRGRTVALYPDSDGNMWVGTYRDGLYRWNAADNRFTSYRDQEHNNSAENEVSALYQDRTGTLWIGTWTIGLLHADLASGGFRHYSHLNSPTNSLDNNRVYKITQAPDKNLWLETDVELNLLNPVTGDVRSFPIIKPTSTTIAQIVTALNDDVIRLWSGNKYNPKTGYFTLPSFGTGDPNSDLVDQIILRRDGKVWIATRGGLFRLDPATNAIKTFLHDPANPSSLADNAIKMVLEDRAGVLWLATEHGLDRMDSTDGSFSHFQHKASDAQSISSDSIQYLFEDKKGALWIGTAGGICKMDKNAAGTARFHCYTHMDGLGADTIGAILEDDKGRLWMSTTDGISSFDPSTEKFQNYTARDGMIEGTYFVGSALRASDGNMYFGGFNGVTAFRPDDVHGNPFSPPVVISDFLLFNHSLNGGNKPDGLVLKQPIYDTKELTLSYRDAVFSIEFAALHYAAPQHNRYVYQLQGFDKNWVMTDASKPTASYTNLDPGQYLFRVKAANKDGVWNEDGASLMITITPPFWQTWWFRTIAALLLSCIVWAAYRIKIRSFTDSKKWLEKEVRSRTMEVMRQKEIVEQKNTLLENQKKEVELQKQEAEHRREEAEFQKEKVEQANRNISILSDIGRAITATLNRETILATVYTDLTKLMPADEFCIVLCHAKEDALEFPFTVDHGQRKNIPNQHFSETSLLLMACIAHRADIFINDFEADYNKYIDVADLASAYAQLPGAAQKSDTGSRKPQSMMLVPMLIQDRVSGVIIVQSIEKNGYERTHMNMLLTLAAYAAVALDHADAYLQLQNAQEQLVLQEKMASLGTLTAGVAHEINNPTNFSHVGAQVLGIDLERFRHFLLNLAGDDADEDVLASLNKRIDDLKSQTDTIIEGTTRIRNLVLDLRTFSRLDQTATQTIAIASSLRSTVNLVRTQFADTAEIELDLAADPLLECRPAELNQVFMNLIVNACQSIESKHKDDHSDDHNEIRGRLLISSRIQGEWLEIEFKDDGCGIPKTIIDHIFEPFFTTKKVGDGTGLGLSISFGIIDKHHGNIRVTSTEGEGSCFTLMLPLAPQAGASSTRGGNGII